MVEIVVTATASIRLDIEELMDTTLRAYIASHADPDWEIVMVEDE